MGKLFTALALLVLSQWQLMATNLLVDPGFETQSGWILFNGAQYSQNYAHSGSWSMLDAASDGVPGCYQQFPASPGMEFEMTGYGFTPSLLTGGTAYGILEITFFDSSNNNLGTVETSPGNALASQEINSNTPAGVWTFLDTGVAIAPPNTAYMQAFTLYVGFSGTDEGVYFDDLSLSGGTTPLAPAPVLLGGFQGPSDSTDTGWINPNTGNPIISDNADSFVAAGVPGYAQSLKITGTAGSFGSDSLELKFSQAQIAAFNANSWVTFTFSVPAWTNGGYSQIYNLAFNASGYGYNNLPWTNAQEMGKTNSDTAGAFPNFYFYNGVPMQTQVITVNYSAITNAIIKGGEGYLDMIFQGNQGGGAPPYIYLNSVVLSTTPFGTVSDTPYNFIVDDFSPNGVSPNNSAYDDYYPVAENYASGQITNVWRNLFGEAFSNVLWAAFVDAGNSPYSGSLEIQLDWTPGSQFAVWDGANYHLNISSLTYTNFQCDVMYAPGSASGMGTENYTNFGQLRFGVLGNGYTPDWFGYTNISATNTGWVHISLPLSTIDPNLLNIQAVIIGTDSSVDGSFLNGPSTLYVDNVKFTGPQIVPPVPPPVMGIQKAIPAMRIFAGDYASEYSREEVATVDSDQSWISPKAYPVTYSFTLLSDPGSIDQTHVFLVPITSLPANGNDMAYGNEYVEYQASNACWLDIQPVGAGKVTASVLWKTNAPNANPAEQALIFTNSTAIGTWTWTFNNASSGTVTGPKNAPMPFTITDVTVSVDFSNPLVAYFGLQPNSAAGVGQYEDWASISIGNVAGTSENEIFTNESSDFAYSYPYSPSGEFRSDSSENPAGVIVVRTNLDAYWVNWTVPAINYIVVAGTSLQTSPGQWIAPAYYGGYTDYFPPRGAQVQLGNRDWMLLPTDDLPTADGGSQDSPPEINDPLSRTAFFRLTTNTINAYP